MSIQDGFVRVTAFPDPIMANLAKSKLESEGIQCFLTNENTIRMDYFYSQALGGVELYVREEDVAAAQKALGENHSLPTSVPSDDDSDSSICEKCGSKNIYNDRRPSKISIISFFLGLPFLLLRRKKRCANCGYEWK